MLARQESLSSLRFAQFSQVGERNLSPRTHGLANLQEGFRLGSSIASVAVRHCPTLYPRYGRPTTAVLSSEFPLKSTTVSPFVPQQEPISLPKLGTDPDRRALRSSGTDPRDQAAIVGQDRYLHLGTQTRHCEPDSEWSDSIYDDPFGLSPNDSKAVTLEFRGELTIDGLVFMGDRIYDPTTRSFLSRDRSHQCPAN